MLGEWKGPTYDHIYSLVVSANGARTAFVAQRGKRSFVVSRDWSSEEYDSVRSLSLNRDGSRLMCVAERAAKDYVLIDREIIRSRHRPPNVMKMT
jgi:hypothetical protein